MFALGRVYRNIILNAIQATTPGGGVRVEVDTEDGRARVRVTDTGCGIPPDRLEAIFEDFTTTEKVSYFFQLLAGVNLVLFLFNLLPIYPLDGGHIAGALYEKARSTVARLRGRPDPGPFDIARLMPPLRDDAVEGGSHDRVLSASLRRVHRGVGRRQFPFGNRRLLIGALHLTLGRGAPLEERTHPCLGELCLFEPELRGSDRGCRDGRFRFERRKLEADEHFSALHLRDDVPGDLRNLCREASDYSSLSPIEPSAAGGGKIARAIVSAVLGDEPASRVISR